MIFLKEMERSAGVLLPVFSIPSPYGIGTFGKEALRFIDFLKEAGQSYWQVLPLGPTGFGDSPYQNFSCASGNPYLIDIPELICAGLLSREEADEVDFGTNPEHIDYGALAKGRMKLLEKAAARGLSRENEPWKEGVGTFASFCEESADWLTDYALFMALKEENDMRPWNTWDEGIRFRTPKALKAAKERLSEKIRTQMYIQYLFFTQWKIVRDYAHAADIRIIGDMPLYMAYDAADVWVNAGLFLLDEKLLPVFVAGVPPDYFSEDGQLWGNPLYRWEVMKQDGYGWWIRRIAALAKLYDVIRIDHFRGLYDYWAVPYSETSAKNGHWEKAPGLPFVRMLTSWFSEVDFIAEDLGTLSDEVKQFRLDAELPGMKVLEFAFSPDGASDYLPHRFEKNTVCYIGTHDNAPVMEWKKTADPKEIAFAVKYLGLNEKEGFHIGMLRAGLGSVAALSIAQIQDWLGIEEGSRINVPGNAFGNWTWRLRKDQLSDELAQKMRDMTKMYGR